jgi:hypothetical protein
VAYKNASDRLRYERERREELRANEICIDCKAEATRRSRCDKCHARAVANVRASRERKRANGLCFSCPNPSPVGWRCERCREIVNGRARRRYAASKGVAS